MWSREVARFWAADRLLRVSDPGALALAFFMARFGGSCGAAPAGRSTGTRGGLANLAWGPELPGTRLCPRFRPGRACTGVARALRVAVFGARVGAASGDAAPGWGAGF
jgi:hypothetical protein